jgi:hypothetical protein
MAVKIQVEVFLVVVALPALIPLPTSGSTSRHHELHPEDGGRNVIRNVGIRQQHYSSSQASTTLIRL